MRRLLALALICGYMNLGFAVTIQDCGEREFSIEAKGCTDVFVSPRCPEGRVRYLGICADPNILNLSSDFEVPESIREGILISAREQLSRYDELILVEYQTHVARALAQSASAAVRASREELTTQPESAEAPVEPVEPAVSEAATSANETISDNQDQLDENFNVFDPDECEWVESLPRKIHEAPGCGRGSAKVCVGYVACKLKNGEGKFIRASTCDPDHCGSSPSDASACTKDPHFWSKQAEGSSQKYIGSDIRSIIHRGLSQ